MELILMALGIDLDAETRPEAYVLAAYGLAVLVIVYGGITALGRLGGL
ncbi:hypothetical protein LA345_13220 [Burkholderia vietnamiensis]|nr:hypothetical protein [Burkholderia vietnamiensis]